MTDLWHIWLLSQMSWYQHRETKTLCHIYILFYKTKYKLIVSNTCDFYILIFENRTGLFSFIECSILCTPLRTYLLSYKIVPISAFCILDKLILSHTHEGKWLKGRTNIFRCIKLYVKVWFSIYRYDSDFTQRV